MTATTINRVTGMVTSMIFMLVISVAGRGEAADYEIPANRPVSEVLRPEVISGPHYRINDPVVSYGFMHHYTVSSDYGPFEVTGDLALAKLLKEIQAITALKQVKGSKVFAESVAKSAGRTVHLGKNLITHPVDTVTGVPKGVFTLFGNITEGVSEKVQGETDPSEDARSKQILQVSAYKREWAAKLGVDVYSSNKVLQKELNSVGWAGSLGNLALTAVTMPASGPMTALKMARTADQLDEVADQLKNFSDNVNKIIAEEPPARLHLVNEKKFTAMGISQDLVDRYLTQPHFTPRHDTIIAVCLDDLKGARGRDVVLQIALAADSEVEADFVQHIAQTLRGYHQTVSPISALSFSRPFVLAQAENGTTLIPFPLDYGVWNQRADRSFQTAVGGQQASDSAKKIDVWVTGAVSPLSHQQLKERGITVTEHVDTRVGFLD